MEKLINPAVATFISILLLLVYLLPSYDPCSNANSISNGSALINGSISGIPAGVSITLFIVNNNNNDLLVLPPPVLTSADNTFSREVRTNDGDPIAFRLNGKDSGTIVTFHPGISLDVKLTYTAPGSGDIIITPVTATPLPVTATPIPVNATVTPTATATPTATPVPTSAPTITATPLPITATPTASPPSPSPAAASPGYTAIYAIAIGILALAALVAFLRKM